ncbi:MAG TPA: hypothetical protein VHB98_05525 [Chloroflexota bacterium]|jgi:hypothetical protein|nr:hypothetical protein [Chloroflexota bacterium]
MADHNLPWSGDDTAEDALAQELRALRPTILRQQHAEAVRPDPSFASRLRARLVGVPGPEPLRERLRRVIATLVPPPAPRLALAGVRGAAGAAQPATYAAEDVQITISRDQQATAATGGTLRGMVISTAHAGDALVQSRVELYVGESVLGSAPVDEFGAFTLANVPAADYTVQVTFPDRVVVIPSPAVGAQ